MPPLYSPENNSKRLAEDGTTTATQFQQLSFLGGHHLQKIAKEHSERLQKAWAEFQPLAAGLQKSAAEGKLAQEAAEYAQDAAQRAVLTLDVLRQRAEQDIAHEKAGTPPVVMYDYEIALDGHNLPRPSNYLLLKITPPAGVEVFDWKRPYMIIDPRAGHGGGIGGFKSDSQVGVALHAGHPVYLVCFRPQPEPDQTLVDVVRTEAAFVAEIHRRHPEAPKPVVIGNCQGGWAALILAATNPDITGPIVINGSPVSPWSGRLGENPMRYNGGLQGGITPALLASDLGDGVFDGAHLIGNFEQLNPSRNFFGKYYDLFTEVDSKKAQERFLEFEKWWGGVHFMNEAEIHWIVDQIFIGNKLARGEARLEHGRPIDLKRIRSPIIVFASWGDNITPPQQALNWIADTYADEHEIKVRGQRIVYMVHDKVGHLGIFVSSSIAKKEHSEVTSTMKTIEALSPGLYEMVIDNVTGEGVDAHFAVSFVERKMSDLKVFDDNRDEEKDFGAVARLSELGAELYELTLRPLVQSMVTPKSAELLRQSNSFRSQRRAFGDANPLMKGVEAAAQKAEQERKKANPSNPFLIWEKLLAGSIEQSLDLYRDLRDAAYETAFYSIYSTPFMTRLGADHAYQRARLQPEELRLLPEVQAILPGIDRGGFEEAVIRMLVLMAQARGEVRRDRLERSAKVLSSDEPFASLGADRRAALIREQSIIVEFEPEQAIKTLPQLLEDPNDRQRAIQVVEYIAGSVEEMEPHTVKLLNELHAALGLPGLALPRTTQDPLLLANSQQSAAE
jgi:pimeloyl-ACP methyl ester carboxylesterase/tellurite resistance protein